MYRYYIGIGSNLGDKQQNLLQAVERMGSRIGRVTAVSSFYDTEPWGFQSANRFLNGACCVESLLPPLEVLEITQTIEREMGRTVKSADGAYHDRLIDIDLLQCYDASGSQLTISDDRLQLPHPLMEQREFVMKPLSEIK